MQAYLVYESFTVVEFKHTMVKDFYFVYDDLHDMSSMFFVCPKFISCMFNSIIYGNDDTICQKEEA